MCVDRRRASTRLNDRRRELATAAVGTLARRQLDDSGCPIPQASNYDSTAMVDGVPAAHIDVTACVFVVSGCTSPDASNYVASATVDDGSCCVDGCTDADALNFVAAANKKRNYKKRRRG